MGTKLKGPCGRGVVKVELPAMGLENRLTASGVKLVGHALLGL